MWSLLNLLSADKLLKNVQFSAYQKSASYLRTPSILPPSSGFLMSKCC
ncbi:hypothetical protein HMPREF1991_00943 [Hoylesella loescheii DSM 19665 = JCM 12249 = ATCC 15930]|uniref:Uncharacterized protein n=1 Tax=Hoylesella loescheii DSM 19665 = JCM 12249 = ATCC 15930 TaxID=1122985 RepID=A0A069QJF7_HOYLO|nr:hypothetical protein HMPREF1991_00943 [Hoylesella loescheii DSM 19665 = JCM 12249 = ATCC 15930]